MPEDEDVINALEQYEKSIGRSLSQEEGEFFINAYSSGFEDGIGTPLADLPCGHNSYNIDHNNECSICIEIEESHCECDNEKIVMIESIKSLKGLN